MQDRLRAVMSIASWSVPALVTAALSSALHATVFYGAAGTAIVVDSLTGRPIEGVIVEASWEITNYRDPAAPPLAEMVHSEARTDANGAFTLPAWGPLAMDLRSYLRSVVKVLDHFQPHLHLYKRGYHSSTEKGPSEDPRPFWEQLHLSNEDHRQAWWNKHTFSLEPNHASIEQRRHELSSEMAALGNCQWVRMPRIAAAYIAESRQLARIAAAAPDPKAERLLSEKCPDALRPLTAYLYLE